MVDSWESFFREKSRRRSSAVQVRSLATWSAWTIGLLLLVTGVLKAIDL